MGKSVLPEIKNKAEVMQSERLRRLLLRQKNAIKFRNGSPYSNLNKMPQRSVIASSKLSLIRETKSKMISSLEEEDGMISSMTDHLNTNRTHRYQENYLTKSTEAAIRHSSRLNKIEEASQSI